MFAVEDGHELAVRAAMSRVDADAVADLVAELVAIDSPTGDEAAALDWVAGRFDALGIEAIRLDDLGVVGRIAGAVPGHPSLLLYAPVDTHVRDAADRTRLGGGENLVASARRQHTKVAGLGAENPKGFAAAVLAAAVALSGQPQPRGDLLFGIGAGGMPIGDGKQVGHGSGARAIATAMRPTQAVIGKPGWVVSGREVGLCWLRIEVHAPASYVGVRHLGAGETSVQRAGRLLPVIDDWLVRHADLRRADGLFPQGAVTALRAGDPQSLAFAPAVCELFVDLRVVVGDSPDRLADSLRDALLLALGQPQDEAAVRVTPTMWVPAQTTPDDAPVMVATTKAWQAVSASSADAARTETSGVTDAVVLRACGIPTARVGMPRRRAEERAWSGPDAVPLNEVDAQDCLALTEVLVRATLDLCG